MAAEIEPLLRRALASCGRDPALLEAWTPLSGSSSSQSYRVDIAGETLVVRLNHGRGDPVLSLGREYELLVTVAAAGIGPPVVGIDPACRALVTRFVDAQPWTPARAREPANIARAASLLHELHALDAATRRFEPEQDAALYWERARRVGRIDARDRALADELTALAHKHTQRGESYVLCHNDLVAANVLDAGALLLVDFEYAVKAPAIVDLASLAAMNDFEADERTSLLDAYYGAEGAGPGAGALEEIVRLQRLLAYFWALSADSETLFAKRSAYADRAGLNGR